MQLFKKIAAPKIFSLNLGLLIVPLPASPARGLKCSSIASSSTRSAPARLRLLRSWVVPEVTHASGALPHAGGLPSAAPTSSPWTTGNRSIPGKRGQLVNLSARSKRRAERRPQDPRCCRAQSIRLRIEHPGRDQRSEARKCRQIVAHGSRFHRRNNTGRQETRSSGRRTDARALPGILTVRPFSVNIYSYPV
jgi:hypothetical protein